MTIVTNAGNGFRIFINHNKMKISHVFQLIGKVRHNLRLESSVRRITRGTVYEKAPFCKPKLALGKLVL